MAQIYVWGMYRIDITQAADDVAAGETIDEAKFGLYLQANTLTTDTGQAVYRGQSANGTDDQDWSPNDTVAKLYDNICEYTRTNETYLDRIILNGASPVGQYYEFDILDGLLAAIADGDQYLTFLITRDVTQDTGTKTKAGSAAITGPIDSGGSGRLTWQTSEGANPPYLDYELAEVPAPVLSGRGRRKISRTPVNKALNQVEILDPPENITEAKDTAQLINEVIETLVAERDSSLFDEAGIFESVTTTMDKALQAKRLSRPLREEFSKQMEFLHRFLRDEEEALVLLLA